MALTLAACGFKPLYGERSNGAAIVSDLSAIDVTPIGSTSVDRELRQALEDRLYLNGPSPARYEVRMESQLYETDVAVRQDTNVTRKNIHLNVDYSLVDLESGTVLLTARTSAIGAYNRVASEFANIIASRDAAARVAQQVADDISLRLAIYFERQSS